MEITPVTIIRGSDHNIRMVWKDSEGDFLDFTGFTLSFFDVSPALAGRVTGTISVPLEGTLAIKIEGMPPLAVGLHSFRILLTAGSDTIASRRIYVRVE